MISLAVVLGTAGVVGVVRNDQNRERVTYKTLDADPEFYAGKTVRISTEGSQPGTVPNQLVFRKRADHEPVVVLVFSKAVPDPTPKFVIGLCVGRVGNAVRVEQCRGE